MPNKDSAFCPINSRSCIFTFGALGSLVIVFCLILCFICSLLSAISGRACALHSYNQFQGGECYRRPGFFLSSICTLEFWRILCESFLSSNSRPLLSANRSENSPQPRTGSPRLCF